MDIIEYHKESTREDCETYALVEYFKLLKQIELAGEIGYPMFSLIGGKQTLISLEVRASSGYFDCRKNNQELFQELLWHIGGLKTKSQTLSIQEAIFNGSVIKNFMKIPEELQEEDALTTLTRKLQGYPIEVIQPFLEKLKDSSTKEKEKKIGQK